MEGFSLSDLLTDLPLNLINILLLYLIVSRLLYRPVKKLLNDRAARLQAQQTELATAREAADEKARRYEALMAEAAADTEALRQAARAEAQQKAAAVLETARANAARLEADTKKRTAAEHDAALADLRDEVATLATDIAEKVLQRQVSDDDTRRIAEDFFAALPTQGAAAPPAYDGLPTQAGDDDTASSAQKVEDTEHSPAFRGNVENAATSPAEKGGETI